MISQSRLTDCAAKVMSHADVFKQNEPLKLVPV